MAWRIPRLVVSPATPIASQPTAAPAADADEQRTAPDAADALAAAVREFLSGTPYRHTPPSGSERDRLARALGHYDAARRRSI